MSGWTGVCTFATSCSDVSRLNQQSVRSCQKRSPTFMYVTISVAHRGRQPSLFIFPKAYTLHGSRIKQTHHRSAQPARTAWRGKSCCYPCQQIQPLLVIATRARQHLAAFDGVTGMVQGMRTSRAVCTRVMSAWCCISHVRGRVGKAGQGRAGI